MPAPRPANADRVTLSDIVFLRVPSGSWRLLESLRRPASVTQAMDDLLVAQTESSLAVDRAAAFEARFTADEWASLQTWRQRAVLRSSVGWPRLLDRAPGIREAFQADVEATRELLRRTGEVDESLADAERCSQQRIVAAIDDPLVRLMVGNAGRSLAESLRRLDDGGRLNVKEQRRFARTVGSLLARSALKSCPLAFAADTAVLRVDRNGGPSLTRVEVGAIARIVVTPNQDLANRVVTTARPGEVYLRSGGHARFTVTASTHDARTAWWAMAREPDGIRETLLATRLPGPPAHANPAPMTHPPAEEIIANPKLWELGLVVRDDLVSPMTADAWPAMDAAVQDAADADLRALYESARERAQALRTPQPVTDDAADRVADALNALQDLGAAVAGSEPVPSACASADTYRTANGALSQADQDAVAAAIEQYTRLAAAAYPHTPSARRRQELIGFFRATYGDGVPVQLQELLLRDWETLHRAMAYLLGAEDPPIDPRSDLMWPVPATTDDAYHPVWQALLDAANAPEHELPLPVIEYRPGVYAHARSPVDAVCRLGASERGMYDVVVESATISGRLTERHLRALESLDPATRAIVHRYRDEHLATVQATELAPVTICATPAIPRLQNLSRVEDDGSGYVLALTEPAPMLGDRLLRYSDIYVQWDQAISQFVFTRGPDGAALDFHWPSPLSPSFSRRLHLLRYLSLAGRPVLTAPRWMPFEAQSGGHLPRLRVGHLIVSPERWSVPAADLGDRIAIGPRAARHRAVHELRRRLGLPGGVFLYSSHHTKPVYVDLDAPWSTDLIGSYAHAATAPGETLLFEECLPMPGQTPITSPAGTGAFVFRCYLHDDAPEERSP